jgi:beta-alanine--pyruvate transaminase
MSLAHDRLSSHEPAPNDLDAWWLPFTANRAFKKNPRMICSG